LIDEQHLGGKITMMVTHGQQPNPENVPPDRFQPMRSAYLSLRVDSTNEAERIYTVLSDGGQIFMPIQETFFAFRFGMLRDKFGTSWMILHEGPSPTA
jgi:PhnB protein